MTSHRPERKPLKNDHRPRDAWRVFRMLSEFVEGFDTMADLGPSVSIFGSSRAPDTDPYYKMATDVAFHCAKRGFAIITGGGPGIMEAANKGAQEAQGPSCGVAIELPFEPEANRYIDPKYLITFRYFFVRKVMFVRYAQAFIFLPGGCGTLDELFEIMTLIQTEKIHKVPMFLMGSHYWEGLLEWIKAQQLENGYLSQEDFDLLQVTDDPEWVAQQIETFYETTTCSETFEV